MILAWASPFNYFIINAFNITRLSQATHIARSSAAVTAIFPQLPV